MRRIEVFENNQELSVEQVKPKIEIKATHDRSGETTNGASPHTNPLPPETEKQTPTTSSEKK
jgi:hypothetical protein